MSKLITPTEAQCQLAHQIRQSSTQESAAQLIAESEARAVAVEVTMLTCTHHNDQQRTECPVCLVPALTAERDQLRAALALGQINCDAEYDDLRDERDAARARAERAEAEVERLGHLEAVLRSSAADMTAGSITAGGVADLRAENERLRRAYVRPDDIRAQLESAIARAERAEATAKGWEADSLLRAGNEAYRRALAEKAEAELVELVAYASALEDQLDSEGVKIARASIVEAMKEATK